jgi:hypothetical protein
MSIFCSQSSLRQQWLLPPSLHPHQSVFFLSIILFILSFLFYSTGLAGGLQLGDGSTTGFSAYVQANVDINTPSKTSFYVQITQLSFYNIVRFFAGNSVYLPPWVQTAFSVESVTINFNPGGSSASTSGGSTSHLSLCFGCY